MFVTLKTLFGFWFFYFRNFALPSDGAVDGIHTPMAVAIGRIYPTQTPFCLHSENIFCLSKHVILGYVHTVSSSCSSVVCRKASWIDFYMIDWWGRYSLISYLQSVKFVGFLCNHPHSWKLGEKCDRVTGCIALCKLKVFWFLKCLPVFQKNIDKIWIILIIPWTNLLIP